MKWETLKGSLSAQFPTLAIHLEHHNGNLKAIEISAPGGGAVKIVEEYGSLKLMVPAKPKMVDRWALTGLLLGVTPFHELFESEFDASQRKGGLSKAANFCEDDTLGLTIEKVSVPVED